MSVTSAIGSNIIRIRYSHSPSTNEDNSASADVVTDLSTLKIQIFEEIRNYLAQFRGVKWYLIVTIEFVKLVNNEEIIAQSSFHGKMRLVYSGTDHTLEQQFQDSLAKILESIAKFERNGSGWVCNKVLHTDLYVIKCKPLYASSYIPTPSAISHSKTGIINVRNKEDEKCFLWAVLAALYPDIHRHNRVSYFKKFEDKVNMNGIEYPVKVKDIEKFEIQNPNISINVFGYERPNDNKYSEPEAYPIRVTTFKNRSHHINLLLLTAPVEGTQTPQTHYCLITSLSKFLSTLTKHDGARFYCPYCLHRFAAEPNLTKHIPYCEPFGAQRTVFPEEQNNRLYFKNYTYCHPVPFTFICDFEAFLAPITTCEPASYVETSHGRKDVSYTYDIARHIPSGFSLVCVDSEGKMVDSPTVYYNGKSHTDVVQRLFSTLLHYAERIEPILRTKAPLIMTEEDNIRFEMATRCHLCTKPFEEEGSESIKVRNHSHLNSKFLGAAHQACNLNYQVPMHIPVIFHNLAGYDMHHLVQGLASSYKKRKVSVIARTSERYTSLTLDSLRFIDSMQFMNASLDTLVSNLRDEGSEKFKITRQYIEKDEEFHLLLRKGVYPYDYMTDESKFELTQLPSKEDFFNKLTNSHITDEQYSHAQQVWKVCGIKTMLDYHNLYMLMDTLLLADVWQQFRCMSMEHYEIDPGNMYSAPGLAWNAMLKMTGVELELLTDVDQHIMVESAIRGGVAMISHRYAKAQNSHLSKDEKKKTPTEDANEEYLWYTDANNLYGTSMKYPLPKSDFKWVNPQSFHQNHWYMEVAEDSNTGYILEVDLEYGQHLHDLHADYPLAPVKQAVTEDMLSPYSKTLQRKLGLGETANEKLLTTLDNKKKYVLHYRNLQLYVQLGMKVTKIHRVLSFTQSQWLGVFIDFNTSRRTEATTQFGKDFFKLMNNAVYGKSLENKRGRVDFKLIMSEQQLVKWTASPRLKSVIIYNKDLVGLSLKQQKIVLDKPIYVGFSILEISKTIMYNFHYNWAKAKYGHNIQLCMTDTDSLLYHIKTPDLYKDIFKDLHLFDTSDYPDGHLCHSTKNKKKLGAFKDETNGEPIREFIGLRAKCYSILLYNKQEKKVAKGVLRTAIKTQLRHEAYKQCLFQQMPKSTTGLSIRSERHHVFTKKSKKLSLSPFDDKRYILDDGVHTLPYGHYKIREMRNRKRKREELPHPPTSRPRSPQPSTSRPWSPQPSTSRPWSPQPSTSRQEPS